MRIFHGPIEIAGQIGILCGALRARGHFARGFNFFTTYLGYNEHLLNTDSFEMGRMYEEALQYFDLFHYHYGLTVFSRLKDLELACRAGKPIVMHHWGNDVRTFRLASARNPHVYTGDSPPEDAVHHSLAVASMYVSDAIVQDHEVAPYVAPYYKRVHIVPLAVDLGRFRLCLPSLRERSPLILHAPTNRLFKGTDAIERAILALRKEGLSFRYQRLEQLAHQEAVRLYQQADIIIDQILCGSYGLLGVEGMAYGKPVVAYVREDLAAKQEVPPPICNANPDTIYDVLKRLILSPELRRQAGRKGRSYVERVHDSHKVADKLLEVYRIAQQQKD